MEAEKAKELTVVRRSAKIASEAIFVFEFILQQLDCSRLTGQGLIIGSVLSLTQ